MHDGRELRLEGVVKELRANLAQEDVELADSMERLGHARLLGGELRPAGPANGCREVRMRSHADPDVDPCGCVAT
jgi:hypothetical protein